jgi:hypothetical protein
MAAVSGGNYVRNHFYNKGDAHNEKSYGFDQLINYHCFEFHKITDWIAVVSTESKLTHVKIRFRATGG